MMILKVLTILTCFINQTQSARHISFSGTTEKYCSDQGKIEFWNLNLTVNQVLAQFSQSLRALLHAGEKSLLYFLQEAGMSVNFF